LDDKLITFDEGPPLLLGLVVRQILDPHVVRVRHLLGQKADLVVHFLLELGHAVVFSRGTCS
jgi:hypothetical protein